MPEHHHGDPGMHSVNDMWHYFGIHHWWSWLIFIAVIVLVVYFFRKSKGGKSK
jgi:hypothetical protein